jgi:hypothetical protein
MAPALTRRSDVGNRASLVLVEEGRIIEVPGGLDFITEDVDKIISEKSRAAEGACKCLIKICTSGKPTHPRTAVKECNQSLVSDFVATSKQTCPQLNNTHTATLLCGSISTSLEELYKTGILRSYQFYSIVNAADYCMNQCMEELLNDAWSELMTEIETL